VFVKLRSRLTYANLMATVAVFIALGGSSYAAITVTGKNVKDSSLTGKDVKNSSLTGSDVKNSSLTGSDIRNNRLTGSDILESSLGKVPTAAAADRAGTASNADTVGGKSASAFAPGSTEGLHSITPESDWSADVSGQPLGFWKDPWGDVHLQGAVVKATPATDGSTIFTLPSGYRPGSGYADFVQASSVGTFNWLDVGSTGGVTFFHGNGSTSYVSLEGIVFRAHG
jgi:hypothetical protein